MKSTKGSIILIAVLVFLVGAVIFLSSVNTVKETDISSLADLSGKTVGVQTGTLYEDALLNIVPDAEIVYFTDPFMMYTALEQGKIEAALSEEISFSLVKKDYPTLEIINEPTETLKCCVGFGKTEKKNKLYNQFEQFLSDIKSDGTHDKLYDYWFKDYDPEKSKSDKSGITGENGKISIAMESTYEPFQFISNGEYQGYNIDIIYAFCRMFGYEPELNGMTYDALAPALASGKYDFGMNIILSPEREEEISLSTPYIYIDIDAIISVGTREKADIFTSLKESFYKTFIKEDRWMLFVNGLMTTLIICVLSIIIGTVLGIGAYLLCYGNEKIANGIMSVLCNIFNGLPSVVLLMIVYYLVFAKIHINNIAVSVIAFSLLFCFNVFEIIKTGVNSIGIGQYEAARAQGFSLMQTFFYIIFPQVISNCMPIYIGSISSLIKETSIVGYIAINDLTKMSDIVRGRTYEPFFPLIVTALIYYIIILIFTTLISHSGSRLDKSKRKPKI